MRCVEAVQRTGSFTAAAEVVGISQPALSRTIAEFERRVGIAVFERTTRSVRVTATGAEIVRLCSLTVHGFDDAVDGIRSYVEGRSGPVRIACLPSIAATLVPPVVAEFGTHAPDVALHVDDVQQNRAVAAVLAHDADFGVVASDAALPKGLVARRVITDPFVALVPPRHPLAARKEVAWSDLSGEPFVRFDEITSIGPIVARAFADHGARMATVAVARGLPAAGGYVAAGLGVTAVPSLVLPLVRFGGAVAVRLLPEVRRDIVVVSEGKRVLQPAALKVIDALVGAAPGVMARVGLHA